jgi:signal transduction histidine kinase
MAIVEMDPALVACRQHFSDKDHQPLPVDHFAHRACLELRDRLGLLMATTAHDLREPLGGVKLAASILSSESFDLNGEDARSMLDAIVTEVDRLTVPMARGHRKFRRFRVLRG